MAKVWIRMLWVGISCGVLTQCATSSMGSGNLGGPTLEDRTLQVANEQTGDFYYGRRYHVQKTRFWGYLRKPRQPWSRAKLVIFREDRKKSPDRLPESGAGGRSYAFDNNYEYRVRGYYTGQEAYDPNSNQFLSEFMLTDYDVIDRKPGWLFRPDDRYDPVRITMTPR